MKNVILSFASLSMLAAACPAAATVIDFDTLARDGTGTRLLDETTLSFGDYQFVSTSNVTRPFNIWDRNATSNADKGGASLSFQWSSSPMVLSRTDGALFDLLSLDVADYFNWGVAAGGYINFDFGDGSTESIAFKTDFQAGLETLLLNRTKLRSVTFSTVQSNWWQYDNFVVEKSVIASPVPEPASWALMIGGLLAIGSSMRRRAALSTPSFS